MSLFHRASITLVLLSMLGVLPGCVTVYTRMRDVRDELAIQAHNKYLANMAWKACHHVYDDLPCKEDFESGFKKGYLDRASGLNGCPPALPPRRYWKAKNMGMNGADRTNTWFDGYRHGVAVAEQDGVADLSRITTSVPWNPPPPTYEFTQPVASEPEPIPEQYLNGAKPVDLPSPVTLEDGQKVNEPTPVPEGAAPKSEPRYDEAPNPAPATKKPAVPPEPQPPNAAPPEGTPAGEPAGKTKI